MRNGTVVETCATASAAEPREQAGKPKLAIMTNIVAPYRMPVYERLGEAFDTIVLHASAEANRPTWKELPGQLTHCRHRVCHGLKLPARRRASGGVFRERYLHLSPGYFFNLLRERPDAIITTEMGFRSLAALAYATLFRKPLWIWSGVTHTSEQDLSAWKGRLRRWLARRAVRWISYGQAATRYLDSLGVAGGRILQIQNCVDETRFQATGEKLWDIRPRPVLLCVGRFVGLKGLDLLLQAAARVQARGEAFSLVLIGSGPQQKRLERLARELELRNVHFEPPQKPEAMAAVYRSADVLVFPTLEDIWGLVVNEAMLSGLPVLCSVHAGCAEELIPPEDRFAPAEPGELDRALARAVRGEVARPDVSRLRTSHEVADAIVEDIRGVLAGRLRRWERREAVRVEPGGERVAPSSHAATS